MGISGEDPRDANRRPEVIRAGSRASREPLQELEVTRSPYLSDSAGEAFLAKSGIRVLRFYNQEVYEGFDGVLRAIWFALERGITPPIEPRLECRQ